MIVGRPRDHALDCCYARNWGPEHLGDQARIDRAWKDRPEASGCAAPERPRETVREALDRAYGR